MSPVRIEYDDNGFPTNLPAADPLLLYGVDLSGVDPCGPVLGQWDATMETWSDHKYGQIDWHPMFYAIPPANPCRSVATPTVGDEVI